ncbi:MAG: alpha-galactosidase [Luteolibacter sp.]
MNFARFLSLSAVLLAPVLRAEGKLRISNADFEVEYDPASAEFSIQHKPSGKVFAKNGRFENGGGKAEVKTVTDKTFGQGRSIEINCPNGNHDSITLCSGLPFVLFSGSLHNGTAGPVVHNKVPTFSARVETGAFLTDVKTLGTGGLLAPEKNPGSYAFLTIADPATRSGAVGGWITHERGSGVVFSPVKDGAVRMQARIDYGRLRIKPGADAATETFALGWFDDARLGMERYADAIAKVYQIKLPRQKAGFCTWYMEKHAGACDEIHLPEVSAVAAKELKPFGFDFIQIDDQWQDGVSRNGPKKNFTTHAPKGPYPSGMKKAADNISSLGLVPGIWFMPFAGNYLDPHFADHQDWFVKNPEGKPYETAWGGTCLDMTNPAVREYVSGIVHRISHDWGYKLFKMDGYWTGSATKQVYVNNGYVEDGIGDATFLNPDKTNIEALRDGTKLVRKAAGPKVFLLGCCVSQNMRSFGGTFGLLDAMRIGPDTGGNIGSPHGSRLWFLNGRVWWNDPDCVFVRKSMHIDRARLNAAWTAISGQLFYTSDWMPETPAERLDIVKRCIPAHGLPARPVDVFESDVAKVWLLTDTRQAARRDVVALYNWGDKDDTIFITTDRVGLPKADQYVAFDFWANKFVAPFSGKITSTLPGNSCRILAVRPVSGAPQLLSTSRHVTQGIVDVTGEKWDAAKSVLSATSKLVENDPYELRIILPVGGKSWRATDVDVPAGVKSAFQQDGPMLRVTLTTPASREVRWSVRFEPAKAESPRHPR